MHCRKEAKTSSTRTKDVVASSIPSEAEVASLIQLDAVVASPIGPKFVVASPIRPEDVVASSHQSEAVVASGHQTEVVIGTKAMSGSVLTSSQLAPSTQHRIKLTISRHRLLGLDDDDGDLSVDSTDVDVMARGGSVRTSFPLNDKDLNLPNHQAFLPRLGHLPMLRTMMTTLLRRLTSPWRLGKRSSVRILRGLPFQKRSHCGFSERVVRSRTRLYWLFPTLLSELMLPL